MVFDAAELPGRRADHRRFGESAEFAAAEGNSYRDQERDACRGDDLRSPVCRRYVGEDARRLFQKDRAELAENGTLARAEFSSGISWMDLARGSDARSGRLKTICEPV